MTAIKTWFLRKNQLMGFYQKDLKIIKETQKAVLVRATVRMTDIEAWIPKSCLTDEWEKDTSNFGYHDYLVETLNNAYRNGILENRVIRSGRNTYDMTSFTHQHTTKELVETLETLGISYMNRKDWNNR